MMQPEEIRAAPVAAARQVLVEPVGSFLGPFALWEMLMEKLKCSLREIPCFVVYWAPAA